MRNEPQTFRGTHLRDLRVMDLGLVNGPSQSKEKSFQRALGWLTATIKTMIPPPALVAAVTAYANHLRAVTGLPPLLVPSPPAQLEQVAEDTVCDMEEDAGSRRLLPRARPASARGDLKRELLDLARKKTSAMDYGGNIRDDSWSDGGESPQSARQACFCGSDAPGNRRSVRR